jgi:two-component system, response regulator / RNA-binding antiterminator
VINVLVVDDIPGRASALEKALSAVPGVRVTCILESALELGRRVAEHKPDVVLIETESPSRDVLEQVAVMSSSAPRPVVLFTDDDHDESIRAAIGAGVSAYIVDGLAPGRLAPIMRVAMERFQAQQRLRAELETTKLALEERKLVDRAKGLLMKQRGVDEGEAFALLRKHAMDRGLKLGEAARQVIDISQLLG